MGSSPSEIVNYCLAILSRFFLRSRRQLTARFDGTQNESIFAFIIDWPSAQHGSEHSSRFDDELVNMAMNRTRQEFRFYRKCKVNLRQSGDFVI
jgi:hypothetical protein